MIEIPSSDVLKDIAFCGAPGTNFVCGAFLRGILRGCASQALALQKAPQNEPSR